MIVWNAWNDLRASIGGRSERSALNQHSRKFGLRSNCTSPLLHPHSTSNYFFALGRYLEEDPLLSANQFWYAGGNPLSMMDPLGLMGIYKWPPNNYSDIPPPPGTPCLQAGFIGGMLMDWKPCEECPGGGSDGGSGSNPPPGYAYGYCGWPSRDPSGGDNDDDDGNGDGNGDDDQEERRDHCFGSGEFLGDSRYYENLVGPAAWHIGWELFIHTADHALRAPAVTNFGFAPARKAAWLVRAYEGFYAIPRETCEQMYPD